MKVVETPRIERLLISNNNPFKRHHLTDEEVTEMDTIYRRSRMVSVVEIPSHYETGISHPNR